MSTSGGPAAISAAFVPGRILRDAESFEGCEEKFGINCGAPGRGETGFVWSSAIGGGLGSRGELDGELDGLVAMLDGTAPISIGRKLDAHASEAACAGRLDGIWLSQSFRSLLSGQVPCMSSAGPVRWRRFRSRLILRSVATISMMRMYEPPCRDGQIGREWCS